MSETSLIPDEYERRARLWPALLVSLPPSLAFLCWFPHFSLANAFVGIVVPFGLLALLAQFGRDNGKKLEPALFQSWGGKPTTQFLRFRSSLLPEDTTLRYHQKLATLVPGIQMPTRLLEGIEPEKADDAYDSCIRFLRENTRDKVAFPLIFAENVNYGFRRNLWGMRPVGVVLSIAGVAVAILASVVGAKDNQLPPAAVIATVLNTFMLVWWLLRITSEWVRVAAFAYAERLVGACDLLPLQIMPKTAVHALK